MSRTAEFLKARWRGMRRVYLLFMIGVLLITFSNFWHAHSSGAPLPWHDALAGVGMLLFATLVFGLARLWLNFMLRLEAHRERMK